MGATTETIERADVMRAIESVEVAKARFLMGDIGFEEFRNKAAEYKRLAEARQMQLWGKVRQRIDVKSLMR